MWVVWAFVARLLYEGRPGIRESASMMEKVTFNVDSALVARAKDVARKRRTTLPRLVKAFLVSIDSTERQDASLSPDILRYKGMFKGLVDVDVKEAKRRYLTKKYME